MIKPETGQVRLAAFQVSDGIKQLTQIIMPAYVIVEVSITDPVTYEVYKKLTPGSMAPYGGKFIVRGGATETLEGDWKPERIVVLEFPSMEQARAWYNSAEYTEAKQIRWKASTGKIILVEGL